MNNIQLGLKFEEKGKKILKHGGYEILEHTSLLNSSSPYDLIIKKGNKEFFIEIRGRTGKNQQYFSFSKNKIRRLKGLKKEVLILLINDNGFSIFNLKDISEHVKVFNIGGKKVYMITSKSLYDYYPKEFYIDKRRRATEHIIIDNKVKEYLKKNKTHKRESFNSVIRRLLKKDKIKIKK